MNILFVSMTFPDDGNQARGSYNFALCRELAATHDVRVCAPRAWPEVLRRRFRGRVIRASPEVLAAGIRAAYPCYWYLPRVAQNRSGGALWRSCRATVDELTRAANPDVVLSYWVHPDGEVGLRAARRYGALSAVIVGGSDVLLLPHIPGRGPSVRRVLAATDIVITVSEGLREAVLDLGVPSERVHTIYQGVMPEIFHAGSRTEARAGLGLSGGKVVILWVGRMVGLKRLDLLLRACAILRSRSLDFELCLVGDGEGRQQTRRDAEAFGLADRVRFVGNVPYQETAEWYRAADVTVLCSDSEGLPNVLRESLSCGVPFVATDVGSIREIADESSSVLTPPGDAQALAEGISVVLSGPYRAAAQRYRPRSWADCATELEAVIDTSRSEATGRCGATAKDATLQS